MTKEEAREFLTNKKVFVKNKGKEVQDKLFELGYSWFSKRIAEYQNVPFIYIFTPDHSLGFGEFDKDNIDCFYTHCFNEISVEDILNIEIEDSLPKTWEEYSRENKHWSIIPEIYNKYEAHEKLLHLRDCYRRGWKPKDRELRWNITPINEDFIIENYIHIKRFLSFQSKEIAEEFLKNFKDLIIQAGDFI